LSEPLQLEGLYGCKGKYKDCYDDYGTGKFQMFLSHWVFSLELVTLDLYAKMCAGKKVYRADIISLIW
jgi:hypothetical protein